MRDPKKVGWFLIIAGAGIFIVNLIIEWPITSLDGAIYLFMGAVFVLCGISFILRKPKV